VGKGASKKSGKGYPFLLKTVFMYLYSSFMHKISFAGFYCCSTRIFKGHCPLEGEGVDMDTTKSLQNEILKSVDIYLKGSFL